MNINDKSNPTEYKASADRYDNIKFNRSGNSGILLPAISIGLWHNFGFVDSIENGRNILKKAFDLGITHFDLANNYGPPYGSAEENFGTILKKDFSAYRDELFIASKAGYDMWPGPYGNWGSKKYLTASIDQSLKRMGLDYVDVFYHHRPDPNTPLEETMMALHQIVQQGKALYIGISNYKAEESERAIKILKSMGTPCFIHQARYSMFDRWVEDGLLTVLENNGVGSIVFSPLAQGLLTDKYLKGIPKNSRAARSMTSLKVEQVNTHIEKIKDLHEVASKRGQTLSQMAIAWLLKDKRVTSVLIGASSPNQLEDNIKSLDYLSFEKEELNTIESILKS